MELKLKARDPAPNFVGTATSGRFSLSEYRGKQNVVLYFYPKDDTRSCTVEACSFRDKLQPIGVLWTQVVGVSVDTVESHKEFARKNGLNFPLVSDSDKRISKSYGVLSEDGSHAERATFIIDREGKIAKIFPDVDVTRHADEIVEALKQLKVKKEVEKL